MNFLLSLLFAALANGQMPEIQIPIVPATIDDIPHLGFGTWNLPEETAVSAVSHALQIGYRHIDAAAIYRNEKYVGIGISEGLKKAGLVRSDIWVTSKLWNDHHKPEKVEEAIDQTLSDLGLEYLDLYHMHWPVASTKKHGNKIDFLDTWESMTRLLSTGKTRNIGVSNFSPEQLETLLNHSTQIPFAHQMELHPYLQQNDWIAFHKAHGIHVTAYSPLAGSNPTYDGKPKGGPPQLLENEDVVHIGHKHNCTAAQIALAWGLSRGTSVIPKSAHVDRISENYDSPKCNLDKEDFATIDRIGKDLTHRYNNPSKSWGLRLYQGLESS